MLRKIWRNPQAVIGLGLIVLICAVAILAPLLAPHAPDEVNPLMKYQAPSADYPLGTDQLGRCELSRLLYGARASLGLALPTLILLGGIGLLLGMMTACIGGWFDRIVTGISQVFIAFPTLIIAVAIIGVLGNGLQNIIWAVVISMWARFMQLIRTYAKTKLRRDYIVACLLYTSKKMARENPPIKESSNLPTKRNRSYHLPLSYLFCLLLLVLFHISRLQSCCKRHWQAV